ncbi:hypothetical protein O181_079250 [Austropuccinia psidii MF-1]|uniref:Reverse transcriptase Ty1/copia-type domain-containing protein n=1 Tax=Austropuccinia psidii MF-1 TaxID=1389203 RepID=A0A9Q3FEG2_9BASI|nr:hypothetical protein [Austropuccinia psidii MF-1]
MESKDNQTYALTATFKLLRLVLTICGVRGWYVNSFDFVSAYLNAEIDTDIWVRPPNGLHIPSSFRCKLRKALYGTRKAAIAGGNAWRRDSQHLATRPVISTRVSTCTNHGNP